MPPFQELQKRDRENDVGVATCVSMQRSGQSRLIEVADSEDDDY